METLKEMQFQQFYQYTMKYWNIVRNFDSSREKSLELKTLEQCVRHIYFQ